MYGVHAVFITDNQQQQQQQQQKDFHLPVSGCIVNMLSSILYTKRRLLDVIRRNLDQKPPLSLTSVVELIWKMWERFCDRRGIVYSDQALIISLHFEFRISCILIGLDERNIPLESFA